MNFAGPKQESLGVKDPEAPSRPSAAPPPCPRCELVKSQCTKTIINYQKSHRKKVEALRTELKSSRQQVERLQQQLRGYKVAARVTPVVVVLATAGWLLTKKLLGSAKRQETEEEPLGQQQAQQRADTEPQQAHATSKSRQKGSFGEPNAFYYHPQLKRWVERGKEQLCASTTADLPPPPMTNHGVAEAPKRRSVAQRYKLQDNLTVSSVANSDGLLVDAPLVPTPPAYGSGVILAGLCNTDDLMLNSGPPSACSDCSSADSSGSPSSRSNSLMSLARDVREALASGSSSSSASSSRAASACGSTEDSAASPEVAHDGVLSFQDFWGFAYPFGKADGSPDTLLLKQSQAQEQGSTKPSGPDTASVSILCTVDSALLAVHQGQTEPALKAPESPIVFSGELGVPNAAVEELLPACGNLDVACSECGAGLSRSSSLALSFADYVHHADSLPEADLFRELQVLQQQQQDAEQGVDDLGAMCRGDHHKQQQQEQPLLLLLQTHQEQAVTVACSGGVLDDTFSFAPTSASDSQAESGACIAGRTQPGDGESGAAAATAGCRGAVSWPRSVPCGSCLQSDSAVTVAEAAAVAQGQSPAAVHHPEVPADREQQTGVAPAEVAEPPSVDGSRSGLVDMAAVDSAVELLKKLRSSLLPAGSCSAAARMRGLGSQAVGAVQQPRPAPVAAAGISVSLAQAAQKLAGLGLLPPSPSSPSSQSMPPVDADRTAPAEPRQACQQGLWRAAEDAQCGAAPAAPRMTSAGVQTALSAADGAVVSASSCKAFLRRMQADWSRVHDRIGDIVDDYTALAKQVAATAVKQMTLERRCAGVVERNQQLVRQLALEREERGALEQLLEQERQQRLALERQLEEQADQSKAQVGEVEAEAAGMRADMDELLLCLGQESTKVAVLADALRAAGGDPDTMIEQVEAQFVAKGVVASV